MTDERKRTLKELENAKLKLQQAKNREKALMNREKFYKGKADKQRTHHLCNMGGAIQSISKETDSLTKIEFYSLMEQVFALKEVQLLVAEAVKTHEEGSDV